MQPHKKSINFGIFKHPGNKADLPSSPPPIEETFDTPETPSENDRSKRRGSIARHGSNAIIEKLRSIGIKCVDWVGNCEADKVSMGTYDVPNGQEGTYGLVFDNTFSKTVSKTATFVLMTHPSNAPPKSKALITPTSQTSQASVCSGAASAKSPMLPPSGPSMESVNEDIGTHTTIQGGASLRRKSQFGGHLNISDIHTGILWKKRRKRGQGWAKRFFSLDFTSSTLSYYRDRHSSALRGAVPLSLAAVGAEEKTREFSIDSGAEVWHLKANNLREFEEWKVALERASKASMNTPGTASPTAFVKSVSASAPATEFVSNQEWEKAEGLLGRVSGSRDAVRRLAQDTDPKYYYASWTNGNNSNANGNDSPTAGSLESSTSPFFMDNDEPAADRRSFFSRTASIGGSPHGLFRRKASAQQLAVPSSSPKQIPSPGPLNSSKRRPGTSQTTTSTIQTSPVPLEEVHNRCIALLRDLDALVTDFSGLLTETKARRRPPISTHMSRMSIDSVASEEFFDAEDQPSATQSSSQLLTIRRPSDQLSTYAEPEALASMSDAGDSDTSSDAGDSSSIRKRASAPAGEASLFPTKPRSLSSTMAPLMQYRTSIPPPKQPPPSLVSFLRKNAGKDLSTISMPVSANEPLSALQRLAEPLESVSQLHSAAALTRPDQSAERLLHIAAFAVANFASNRVKERAQRKPFNPMLGETYELVRSDLGFRFVSEKVVHRPVRMAWQADALNGAWSLTQSAQPTQKFWGKSAELNTEGRTRLVLHNVRDGGDGGEAEHYSWTLATAYLRNVIAGEKYIEPTANMTIVNETTGMKAVATFKAAGLFSGRSEDVTIALYAADSSTPMSLAMAGKWTTALSRTDTDTVVWEAGPVVENASKNWGFTVFAAALNQVSAGDKKLLPPTDSRLRPDQRALEEGRLDEAEATKAKLEERQRARRAVLESHGAEWKPRFFEVVKSSAGGEESWGLKVGREGYWECRERNSWEGVSRVFEM